MDATSAPPPVQPPPSSKPGVRIGPIIRDVVIVWVLTALGGFVVGIATGGPQRDMARFVIAVAVSSLLLGTVAFTIAGCLAPPGNRWRHLGFVALGAWFIGIVNVIFMGSIVQWIGSAIFIALMMGLGGAISYIFRRNVG